MHLKSPFLLLLVFIYIPFYPLRVIKRYINLNLLLVLPAREKGGRKTNGNKFSNLNIWAI